MVFFERFELLAHQENTSPNAVAKELGISSGSVTAWKNGTVPSADKALLIATRFGVTVDYLLGKDPPAAPDGGRPVNPQVLEMARKIMNLPPEDRKRMEDYLTLLERQEKK